MTHADAYLQAVADNLALGNATEHTHRPALKLFLESFAEGLDAVNEPGRIACGAPDFVVLKNGLVAGYVETKDVGASLSEIEKTDQLKRYRRSLGNLLLTDYVDFRWYVDGELRDSARLAKEDCGRLKQDKKEAVHALEILESFLSRAPEHLASPEDLARRMARLAHMIRDVIAEAFAQSKAGYNLITLRNAFAKTLLPGLDLEGRTSEFADMYAQTLAYGLFAARCNHKPGRPFQRLGAAAEIPKTNPLLRTLFESITGTALESEPFAPFVEDLVQLLGNADLETILAKFGHRTRRQDPVVHFYETFLAEYDPKLREVRGVYYTPEPVVSYIVRSVDALLRRDFGLAEGLADRTMLVEKKKNGDAGPERKVPKVLILDPACGTGTFLYAVIDHVREQMRGRNQAGMWPGFVREQLLPRLFGFELLMAPYAVAHFKLGMQLAGQDLPPEDRDLWAYDFSSDERLHVYLTNTLERLNRQMIDLPGIYHSITEEGQAAADIKTRWPIMVILGNPPYSGHSANESWKKEGKKKVLTFIGKLIEDYKRVDGKPLGEKNPKWLQDDYVKFLRWAQWRIDQTGSGVVGFITNHGYLDNPTFRGMRQSLMQTFSHLYILNLHGNSRKKETCPDSSPDKNVFDIEQGVTIGLFVKTPGHEGLGQVFHADLWGAREDKYEALLEGDVQDTAWAELSPRSPEYLFVPQNEDLKAEYEQGAKITDILPVHSVGVVTARDHLAVHWTADEVWNCVQDFAQLEPEKAREKYALGKDAQDWKVDTAQKDLRESRLSRTLVEPIMYRPFDPRFTYYTGNSGGFLCRPRPEVMRHVRNNNLCLATTRSTEIQRGWEHVFCSRHMIQHHTVSLKEVNYLFPLYLEAKLLSGKERLSFPWKTDAQGRIPNLSAAFVTALSKKLGLAFASSNAGDLKKTFGPEDVLHYAYAVFHSPGYRSRYAEFLKADFPRLPLTSDKALFKALCGLGKELAQYHLLEHPGLAAEARNIPFPKRGNNTVEKKYPRYDAETGFVHINPDQHFGSVPVQVWEFRVGGYQVAEKWLKDRRGHTLTHDDLLRYQEIIVALRETIRLMAEVDTTIPDWPIV